MNVFQRKGDYILKGILQGISLQLKKLDKDITKEFTSLLRFPYIPKKLQGISFLDQRDSFILKHILEGNLSRNTIYIHKEHLLLKEQHWVISLHYKKYTYGIRILCDSKEIYICFKRIPSKKKLIYTKGARILLKDTFSVHKKWELYHISLKGKSHISQQNIKTITYLVGTTLFSQTKSSRKLRTQIYRKYMEIV
jgi:hypothetical protein